MKNKTLKKRAFELTELALGQREEDRQQWLEAECGDDAELLAEVMAILSADSADVDLPGVTLDVEHSAAEDYIGRRIGRYRISELLGEGGMGVVFKAERSGDFEHVVAIKVVRQGLDRGTMRARFDLERDALARIEHPNIARLIDAGVDERDRPYFVMEFVDGVPLDELLAQQDLDLDARLALFGQICDAVSAAHRMLVIHRDIKPGNVLVTADHRPKLLDFGISKLVADDNRRDVTRDGSQLFTPEYASPEQIVGGNITTAVDIYGLGALLYFMLSGERPYGEQQGTLFEYLQSTLQNEPLPPSDALRQRAEGDRSLLGLARRVGGDLDNIVLRALSKGPNDRYASVDDLAEDVWRFMDGKPVYARPPTVAYRFSKFVRRHWLETSMAVIIVVSLAGGFGISLWQANVARQQKVQADTRFNETRTLVNYLMNELYADLENVPGGAALRVSIAETSQQYLDNLAATHPEDPLLLTETAQGYRQLGDMQGSPQEVSLNQPELAEESYSTALEMLVDAERRLGRNDDDIRLRIAGERARTALKLARLKFMHSYTADWASYSAEAIAEFDALVQQQHDFDAWLGLSDARLLDADIAVYEQDWERAETVLDQLVADLDAKESLWQGEQSRQWGATRMRALATRADAQFYRRDYERALASAVAMTSAVEKLRRHDQENVALRRAAWVSRHKAALAQAALERNGDVITTQIEALGIVDAIHRAEPGDVHAKEMIAESNRLIGTALSNLDRHAEAIEYLDQVVQYHVDAASDAPHSERSWRLLADARRGRAAILDNAGFVDRACSEWQRVAIVVDKIEAEFGVSDGFEAELATPVRQALAECTANRGDGD